MGLDWMLHAHKAKTGCEKEYRTITTKLGALDADKTVTDDERRVLRRDLGTALEQVSISPYAVIGAPQVGIDAAATEWFKATVFDPAQLRVAEELKKPAPGAKPRWDDRNDAFIAYWSRPFDQVQVDERGKYVVELAPDQSGLASITGMMCSSLDFRGQVVASAEFLDGELTCEAFDDHTAEQALDYAERLETAVADYKAEHPDWVTRNEAAEYGGQVSANDDIADVDAAVRWLRYWGTRGFGYSGWY